MKGTHLGEFEELVLLIAGILFPDAYGLRITNEIKKQTGRSVAIGAVHSALNRLEVKGFLKSKLDEATPDRGGRRKRLFEITASGKSAIKVNRDLRNSLFNQISELNWKGLSNEGI